MTYPPARLLSRTALAAFFLPVIPLHAQTQVPPAPAQTQSAPAPGPAAPAPAGPPTFPKPDPANFTAVSPTRDEVNAFLESNWGWDDSRMWQVQAVLKTPVEGVSKVIVYVGDKTGKEQPGAFAFFVMPDDKHLIAADPSGLLMIPFGAHPYADARTQLQQRADGPYRGAASKELELVEFADFQCPHCKEAQANMEKLVADFPNARIVFQNDPIPSIHPESLNAAEYGACVAKLGGSNDFFQFVAAVFDGQDGLATSDGATLTLNSAIAKAGLDPAKVSACAATPEIKAQVEASMKLAADLGISSVPTLAVNGRLVSATEPYDLLKKVIEYQAKLDGLTQ